MMSTPAFGIKKRKSTIVLCNVEKAIEMTFVLVDSVVGTKAYCYSLAI